MPNSEPAACPHFDCERRFGEIERRLETLDDDWRAMNAALNTISVKLARLEGRIAGYLVAASIIGSAVAFLAAYVLRNQG